MSTLDGNLRTISGETPGAIRENVVAALREEVEADIGGFFKCVERDGRWYYSNVEFQGNEDFCEALLGHADRPIFESPWTRKHVDAGQIGSFIRTHSYFSTDYLYSFEVQSELLRPLRVTDEVRALFFDGRKFYGWLGLMRRGIDEPFTAREQERVNAAMERFKSGLLAADSLERDFFRPGPLFATCRPDGTIERASWRAKRWMSDERSEELGRLVRRYDRGADERPHHVVDGADLHIVRLDGRSSLRYLVHLDRAALGEFDPLLPLTDRQREVAEYAAVGATNAEIARTLEISKATVKYHLKRTYRRLDIDGRVDLAALT